MDEMKLESWPIDKLIEYARNPRKNDHAVDKVAAAIKEFGFRVPIVAKSDGLIVDGHLRLKAARKLGLTEVPVILADDMTEAQIKAFRISVNRMAEFAEWDNELLALEMDDLKEMGFDLDLTGFDLGEIEDIMGAQEPAEGLTDDDDAPEPQAEAISKMGDIWLLGNHRVMCGDSTSVEAVEKLMDGKKADLVVTDPPYGVSYAEKNKSLNKVGKGNLIQEPIKNDHLKGDNLKDFFLGAFSAMFTAMKPGAPFYLFAPQGGEQMMMMMMMMEKACLPVRHELIWVKNNHVLGRADYHYRHEPILYGWKDGAGHQWYGDRNKFSTWEIDKPVSSKLHPTMKPIDLIKIPIENSSKEQDVVLDLFGGSGTTLIAAEKTGRVARLIELDPRYVDVIIKRWQDYTGKVATHAETNQPFAEVNNADRTTTE